MFTIEIAGLKVQVNNHFNCIYEKCADYLVEDPECPDLVMEASAARRQHSKDWKLRVDHEVISDGEAEYDAAPYSIYGKLAQFDAFWLHSVLLEMDGVGYAFSAPPGCGKSTHAKLWLEAFGSRVRIINGDNPIIRWRNDRFYAYGTPFCGKENYQINVGVPLAGICFLRRAEENTIKRITPAVACAYMLKENFCLDPVTVVQHLSVFDRLLEVVPTYELNCNMDISAAHTAYEGLRKYSISSPLNH